jgi:hypothetical protein
MEKFLQDGPITGMLPLFDLLGAAPDDCMPGASSDSVTFLPSSAENRHEFSHHTATT